MACRRAAQIDLVAFVADPEAEAWDAFRDHYPDCPECSRAVARLGGIEQALAGEAPFGHPEPSLLEEFALARSALADGVRLRIETHLEACRSCADEIAVFRDFDMSQLEGLAPAAASAARRGGLRGAVDRLRDLFGTTAGEPAGAREISVTGVEAGLAFQSETAADAAPEAGEAAPVARLVSQDGESFPVTAGETRIGRTGESDIVLDDPSIHRVELHLRGDAEHFEVSLPHRVSTLRVNGRAVRTATLADGDVLEFGRSSLRFERVS